MDPTVLSALIGLFGKGISALGYNPQMQQFKQSFSGTGSTDPIQALSSALGAVNGAEFGLGQQGLPGTPRSYVQTSPAAEANIPGIPFTFGAGRAIDPAVTNPSLLNGLDISSLMNAIQSAKPSVPQGPKTNPASIRAGLMQSAR